LVTKANIYLVATLGLSTFFCSAHAQTIIADWTFESSQPGNAGPISPEIGSGTLTTSHQIPDGNYSSPVGNGSAHGYASDSWQANDAILFDASTSGFNDVHISWDQTCSSSLGPHKFSVLYKIIGGDPANDFFKLATTYSAPSDSAGGATHWNSSSQQSGYTFGIDSSLFPLLNNAPLLVIKIQYQADFPQSGTSNYAVFDNVQFTSGPVPEPSSVAALGLGVLMLVRRRSRNGRINA
jgi:hypothetical protein